MADDPTIKWRKATPFGIQADEAHDAWYSGHATDVLELDMGTSGLIVATQTGGVWVIDTNGSSVPLSDSWDNPDVTCLASGPDGPRHFFAGTIQAPGASQGVIWETDTANAVPLFAWQPVSSALPIGAGDVHRIVVIPGLRRIVVACSGGLYWATIPAASSGPTPPPREPYVWKQAQGEGQPGDGYYDLAIGSTHGDVERDNLQDRRLITVVAGGESGGIFVGQWDLALDVLVMEPARLEEGVGIFDLDISALFRSAGACSVDSCELRPNVCYAACAQTDGSLYLILRSRDGGRTWSLGDTVTDSTPQGDIRKLAGDQGNDWNNCIAVARTDPFMVALGWQSGPFLSLDGAQTWRQVVSADGHLHADQHALHFSPTTPDGVHSLFVCSDGGVARIDLNQYLDPPGQPFQSNYNRLLPTLQCYSILVRQFSGRFAASERVPGLIATGLQDNGNAYCQLGPGLTPWKQIDGGDGGWNAFLTDSALLHNQNGHPITATRFLPSAPATLPISITQPPEPGGLSGVIEAVAQPTYRNTAGQLLMAVGGVTNKVYGLFGDDDATPPYHLELIATLPTGVGVAELESFHGDRIFVSTGLDARMFVIETPQGQLGVSELQVVLPKPTPSSQMQGGTCTRIVTFSGTDYFAVLNSASATIINPLTGLTTTVTANYVLRLEGQQWVPTKGLGLPGDPMYGMEAVVAPDVQAQLPRALFVSTDDRVYISRDDGEHWMSASQGLPRRPHCADLCFVADDEGGVNLYLSTYGRSVWVVQLR